jgi:hypothetical protein
MTPKQIYIEILRQHAELREMMAAAKWVAQQVAAGKAPRRELKATVTQFMDALDVHNNREEELLRNVAISHRGSAMAEAELLGTPHFEEHKALRFALLDLQLDTADFRLARAIEQALDRVAGHMDLEEGALVRDDNTREDEDTSPG